MFSSNRFNPAHHLRFAKTAAALAAIAVIGAIACGSEEPAPAPQATEVQPAPAVQSIPNAAAAAGLATPEVVLPTRTPTPTNTPLPPATQIALGTLVPITQKPTATPFSTETINVLATYQLNPGEPITWINYRKWINPPGILTAYPEFDPQHEDFWRTTGRPENDLQNSVSPHQLYLAPRSLDAPPGFSQGLMRWRDYVYLEFNRDFEIIYSELMESQFDASQAKTGSPWAQNRNHPLSLFQRFAVASVAPFRSTVLDKLAFCSPVEDPQPEIGCHILHLQQMEELVPSPKVYRITSMLTPYRPNTTNHHYAQVLISSVFTIDESSNDPKPIQIGETVLDHVDRVTPVGREPQPERLIGIDPENIAFMLSCATDTHSFKELLNPDTRAEARTGRSRIALSKFGFTFDELKPEYNHTSQSLALLAHKHFQRHPCKGYCRTGFYQSEEYIAMAKSLRTPNKKMLVVGSR